MKDNTMTKVERYAAWGLATVFSLRMLGLFMVLPVLTTYGMVLTDANETLIGIAIGIYGFTQAILQIPCGLIADRIGFKPIIVYGSLIFAIGSIIAATTNSVFGLILGRALQGCGTISAAVMALLSDLTREQHRTKAMAFIGISFGITFFIAIVLGPIITHIFGLHAIFWIMVWLALASIGITLIIVPSSNNNVLNRDSSIVCNDFKKVLMHPQLLKLNISIMCLHILLILSFIALPLSMEKAGLVVNKHWMVYLLTMFVSFITVIPCIIYSEKNRHMKSVFMSCIAILFCTEILLCLSEDNLWCIIIGIQLFFIAFNIMEALLPSLISKEAPVGHKGTAMGIYSTSQFIGMAVGGGLGGWLYTLQDTWLVFMVGAMISAFWFWISSTMQSPLYLSILRIRLSGQTVNYEELVDCIKAQPGVVEAIVVSKERMAYIKVDIKQTSQGQLEALINSK